MNMLVRSAAVVAVVPAIAQATPALTEATGSDPIFAAIERHRAEYMAYGEAIGALGELEESLPDEIRRNPRVQFGMKDGEPYYLWSHKDIDRKLEWMPDFSRTPKIRADLHAGFERDMKEITLKQDAAGLTAAELRYEKLCYSCQKLAWEIATTVPTSMAGVVAVLRYANEFEDTGDEWPDTDGWHYQLRETLAEALGALI